MTRTERVALQVAAWTCLAEAAAHMAGHLSGPQPPANDTERALLKLFSGYRFDLMGSQRSLEDLMNGFSLVFSLFLATLGALTLLALRRLEAAGLRAFTWIAVLASGLLLAIGLRYFFLAPNAFAAIAFGAYVAALLAGRERPG